MIDGMIDELIRRNNDPYTSAADIRAFELQDEDDLAYTGA